MGSTAVGQATQWDRTIDWTWRIQSVWKWLRTAYQERSSTTFAEQNSGVSIGAQHLYPYSIISVNFRQNYEQETYPNDRYNRIRMVIDFLTSLNDSDAISLYQELKGLKIQ